jgi:1-acyl-sn-glycerol-3-phosphate acyltransferase
MLDIVIDKPYVPVPPHRGKLWPSLLSLYVPHLLRKTHGVVKVECVGAERLRQSIDAGHGVLLAPNHCRDEDPLVLSMLSREVKSPFFIMASWHLFMRDRMTTFLLRRAGAFSIYREGIDRTAVNTAIDILEEAQRPLVIFPEGFIARTNDIVHELLDGVSLITRTAAKRRSKNKSGGKVIVHPIALRYYFKGDIDQAARSLLDEIEQRLSWRQQRQLSLFDRIYKTGGALLALKELEILGEAQNGPVSPRLQKLANAILGPYEDEWLKERHEADIVPTRVKRLRAAILPDMTKGDMGEAESQRRWKQLADLYLAQQLYHYPPDYVRSNPTPERILETIERLEEDLTDKRRIHGPIHATITVGEPIEVSGERPRGGPDPLLGQIREQLCGMLGLEGQATQ